ncbi:DUF1194 domain-containing protein [Pseudooceanicola sp. CBS1P-1]|uniref:DUF1194 domain-containing protein n=1 Tax=Pseudooceanicola albus TaxID=2692189 RepID=A0A6L7G1J1_9RHOB|nr:MULTISPECIES: DUF1194 domain-containing protein [Pseudooceanicola]MBT9382739.1 DUF1194 domain-containing protein [Pseudooceanicola endophyticus]MXN17277.1 DUF1194 domain-containing protein [Pseudooceanicola albus]
MRRGPWLLLALLLPWPLPALASCRTALALGLDVSGSVDAGEYRQQLDGLAAALDNPQVRDALRQIPSAPVRLMVYEWAGPTDQRILAPWSEIAGDPDIDALRDRLRGKVQQRRSPSTALGSAMAFGAATLAKQDCWRRVLDLSGDGIQNAGPHPRTVGMADITVNALVIGPDAAERAVRNGSLSDLTAYFRAYVLRGADAFVEPAAGFGSYEAAMVRKLLHELEGTPLALNAPDRAGTLQ